MANVNVRLCSIPQGILVTCTFSHPSECTSWWNPVKYRMLEAFHAPFLPRKPILGCYFSQRCILVMRVCVGDALLGAKSTFIFDYLLLVQFCWHLRYLYLNTSTCIMGAITSTTDTPQSIKYLDNQQADFGSVNIYLIIPVIDGVALAHKLKKLIQF